MPQYSYRFVILAEFEGSAENLKLELEKKSINYKSNLSCACVIALESSESCRTVAKIELSKYVDWFSCEIVNG